MRDGQRDGKEPEEREARKETHEIQKEKKLALIRSREGKAARL
jgi:hypothetical protein